MTRSKSISARLYRPLAAGVVAMHLALALSGTALAQSATVTPDDDTQTTADQFGTQPSSERTPSIGAEDQQDQENADDQDDATAPANTTADTLGLDLRDANDILDQEALQELRRQNLRENSVDGLKSQADGTRNDSQGVPVGSFTLRPSLTETVGTERTRTGDDTETRSYLRSGLKASATSNWSLHQLKIDAEITKDKTFSGVPNDTPEGQIDAELRLDLTDEMKATLKGGYSLEQEDVSDPNAVSGATTQSDVEQYTASGEITRDLGVLRTTTGIDFTRATYGAAVLKNSQSLDQSDRDENTTIARARLGYELSPALIPFIEASYGKTIYDQHKDSLGFVRNATLYAGKAGVEADFGEKLKGELAGGYSVAEFEDSALSSISALTIDGNATWSPYRGTDLALNLATQIEPSTTAGASGSVAHSGTAVLSQVILQNVTGQVSGGLTLRDYSQENTARQKVYTLGTGVTWGISRSLDMNADVAWEKTTQENVAPYDILRAGVGLTLKR